MSFKTYLRVGNWSWFLYIVTLVILALLLERLQNWLWFTVAYQIRSPAIVPQMLKAMAGNEAPASADMKKKSTLLGMLHVHTDIFVLIQWHEIYSKACYITRKYIYIFQQKAWSWINDKQTHIFFLVIVFCKIVLTGEEIDEDFLASWKLIKVAEDGDFECDMLPSKKKRLQIWQIVRAP